MNSIHRIFVPFFIDYNNGIQKNHLLICYGFQQENDHGHKSFLHV